MSEYVDVYGGAWGREIKADDTRQGVIDDGNVAWEERVVEARRQWPQASAADFERLGERRWRDRASGIVYSQAHGAPLLGVGTDANRFISVFFVEGGKLMFLERADVDPGVFVHHGEFYGAEIVHGQIVKESR